MKDSCLIIAEVKIEEKEERSNVYHNPTLLAKIDSLPNRKNAAVILDFYRHMKDKGSSENHIINNIKVVLDLARFLETEEYETIKKKEQVVSFLNTKIKDVKKIRTEDG